MQFLTENSLYVVFLDVMIIWIGIGAILLSWERRVARIEKMLPDIISHQNK